MSKLPKRYIFVDYDSLKKVKFSKLEKVCTKVFILISNKEENIPANLVVQAQRLGKRVKWIAQDTGKGKSFMLQLSFLMGALHQRADKSIQFAILSDNPNFDSLVNFINNAGRNCLRVQTKKQAEEMTDEELFKGLSIEDDEDDDGHYPEPIRKFKSA